MRRNLWTLSLSALVSASPEPAHALSLVPLNCGVTCYAIDVSADGQAVVGSADGRVAFRWTRTDGLHSLGTLPGYPFSEANGVSEGGSVVVGQLHGAGNVTAFRWTEAEGMAPSPGFAARDISADGSTIVGDTHGFEAYRWTAADGLVGLGSLPGLPNSEAQGVSADGSTVVGTASSSSAAIAFRWTSEGGMVGLGYLPGDVRSYGEAVSADGSTVVGGSLDIAFSPEAFLWTQADGMVGLGFLPGAQSSYANAASGDSSVVVGDSGTGSNGEAWIWDSAHGMRPMDEYLTALGFDLTGWTLTQATGISADGRTVIGQGYIDGNVFPYQGWIAIIPEPGTAFLVMTGLLGLAVRRRRQA